MQKGPVLLRLAEFLDDPTIKMTAVVHGYDESDSIVSLSDDDITTLLKSKAFCGNSPVSWMLGLDLMQLDNLYNYILAEIGGDD